MPRAAITRYFRPECYKMRDVRLQSQLSLLRGSYYQESCSLIIMLSPLSLSLLPPMLHQPSHPLARQLFL